MALDTGLVDWVVEALEPVGVVTSRRMMGGATLYCDGTIFAIVAMDALWFKADAQNVAAFEAAGCGLFTYEREGRVATMNYRRAPDEVYDDADAMREWAMLGIAAGRRAPVKAKRKKAASVRT